MLTLEIDPERPDPRKIGQAVKLLEDHGVALYPTDTVYALGGAVDSRRAVERIYRLKQMDARRPLAIIVSELREAAKYGMISDFAYRQMRRLTPGPYTFVLEASREVPRVLLDKRRQIGIRIPDSRICVELVRQLGRPLLTSSAVPPGSDKACRDVAEGKEAWPSGIDVAIDGGVSVGKVSTVVSLIDDRIEIIRAGLGADELV
jgi:tRNA threonylcarbamoyl adenosine modification protein (Sua5/YciO/YrdC/YwlC family)